jgi:hypothetical protein
MPAQSPASAGLFVVKGRVASKKGPLTSREIVGVVSPLVSAYPTSAVGSFP